MKIMAITGWSCLALYATFVAVAFWEGRNATGDRAMGLVVPLLMAPAIVVASLLLAFLQYRGLATGVTIVAILLVLPIALLGPRLLTTVATSFIQMRFQTRLGQFDDPALTKIAAAIRNDEPDELREALKAAGGSIDWSKRDRTGTTLFGLAMYKVRSVREPECLRILVKAGMRYGDEPVKGGPRMFSNMLSEYSWPSEVIELVLQAGANPNEKDVQGRPGLLSDWMEAERAKILLDHGAEVVNLRDESGRSALMVAAIRARWDLAQLYLDRGCDPNFKAPDGKSAIDIAKDQEASPQRDAFLRVLAARR